MLFRRFSNLSQIQSIPRCLLSSLSAVDRKSSTGGVVVSSQSQSVQRRLLSSLSLIDDLKSSNSHVAVPQRYFFPNVMGPIVTAEDISYAEYYVQLYSVQLLEQDIDLDQVYGTIKVDDKVAFNREFGQDGRHGIDPNGYFRLRGPDCPLWADEYNLVYPKLYRGNHPRDFYHPARGLKYKDDEGRLLIRCDDIPPLDLPGICGIYISAPESKRYPADRLLIQDTNTTCGTVRVAYASFSDSADSYLTIKLLEWKGRGDGANIYGRIFAANTLLDDEGAKILVFDRNRDEETLSIMPGQYIPLQRPNNVASIGHSLELTLSIFHKDMDSRDYHDEPILSETFSIEAKCYTEEDTGRDGIYDRFQFNGKLATFEVQVYWLPSWA